MHQVVFVTGLASSIPFIGRIWQAWAYRLEKLLIKKIGRRSDVTITICSSDGRGEKKALDLIRRTRDHGNLESVCIVGHSNGFRDGLRMCEALYPDTKIDYFAGIDMTLGEFGAEAYGNIQLFHEFHAVLEKADFHKSFKKTKKNYQYTRIRKGHTAAASDTFVQETIAGHIAGVISGQD